MNSQILFEDSDIEMRDSDDDIFMENPIALAGPGREIFMENPIVLAGPGYEIFMENHIALAGPGHEIFMENQILLADPGHEAEESNDPINLLPEEMLIKIFSYLSQNELGKIAPVCKRWNVLTKMPDLWKKVDVKLHGHEIWRYLPSPDSLNLTASCFVSTLPPSVTHMKLHFTFGSHWTEQLDFESLSIHLEKNCPHLEMLILDDARLSNTLLSIIESCTPLCLENVRGVALHNCELAEYPGSEGCGCVSKIEVLDLFNSNLGYLDKHSFSRMPSLKELRLAHTRANDSLFEDETSFLKQLRVLDLGETRISFQTFKALENHGCNLKELYLCQTEYLEDRDLNVENSVFPQLKTFCLRSCQGVTCEGVVFFIQSCQSLENVYVDEDVAVVYAAHSFVAVNKCKLGIVKVILNCKDHRKNNYLDQQFPTWRTRTPGGTL